MIDILGWVGTALVLLSAASKNMVRYRMINSVAAIMWIVYGFLIHNYPTIAVNIFLLIIHLVWFYKNNKNDSNRSKTN